jgi:hypothetical protein
MTAKGIVCPKGVRNEGVFLVYSSRRKYMSGQRPEVFICHA